MHEDDIEEERKRRADQERLRAYRARYPEVKPLSVWIIVAAFVLAIAGIVVMLMAANAAGAFD